MNNKVKYGLVALVFAIVLIVITGPDTISLLKEPIKLNDIQDIDKVERLKSGDHVNLEIKITFGADTVVYTTQNGKNQGETSRYYIIPFYGNSFDDFYCVVVDISKKNFNAMDRAYAAMEKFYNGEIEWPEETYLTIDGVMKKFSSDEKKYLQEFADAGYYAALVLKAKSKPFCIIASIAGIILIAVGVLLFVLGLKQGAAQKANRQALVNANYYTAPQNVTFNNDPNAPAQPQAPPQGFDPYGVANDPRFANLQHNAANSQAPANVTFNNAPAQAQATVNNAAQQVTTIPNEVPAVPDPVEVSPITPLSPIAPMDNNGNQNDT